MRCACVDIGANTTRLLVAEAAAGGSLRTVLAERQFSPLTPDRGTAAPIGDREAEALAAQVAAHVALAREHGAERVAVVATAALRAAANGDEVAALVGTRAGEPLRILDGLDEARYVFAGAIGALRDPPAGQVAVVDIGGGSTEIAVGDAAAGPRWSASVQIGSRVLSAAHEHADPPTAAELRALRADARAALAELGAPPVRAAFAVGGPATTLRRVVGPVLDTPSLADALQLVCSTPAEEAARRLQVDPRRAAVLPAALLLLEAATHALGVALRLCGGGLREGVVRELLADEDSGWGSARA